MQTRRHDQLAEKRWRMRQSRSNPSLRSIFLLNRKNTGETR